MRIKVPSFKWHSSKSSLSLTFKFSNTWIVTREMSIYLKKMFFSDLYVVFTVLFFSVLSSSVLFLLSGAPSLMDR